MTLDIAHQHVTNAETRFWGALVKRYGKRAGDMRYRTDILPADILALAMAYQAACETWRATFREAN